MAPFLFALLSIATDAQVHPAVQLTSAYRPYDVDGITIEQIVGSIARHGPREGAGSARAAGLTKAEVTWTFRTWQDADRCEIADVQVLLDITVEVPRHRNRRLLPHAVSRQFDRYLEALDKHENEHVLLALEAGNAIGALLSSPAEDGARCTQVQRRLNKSAREIVRRYRVLNRQYDLRTRYGGTEGVFLRPAEGQG
ncbi:DUF922 domain-containing protein [Luteimonas vadosa]|uniref:DUF922 domain-containing protein n=1 Tax=Luteimonas vadosa TaxID=1165507 RepID=A0ABP9E5K7_9GAMM